jgi:hypothetical protein
MHEFPLLRLTLVLTMTTIVAACAASPTLSANATGAGGQQAKPWIDDALITNDAYSGDTLISNAPRGWHP